ncbi:GDSL-like Lipase/Acylhydrolase [uncultured Eubacterium sp.]|nr:GDSL-like Lipase/Acylhydrolase [uncultured Eubacterium sp.]
MRTNTQTKRTHGKKYLIFILVLLILVSLFFINFMRKNSSADYSSKTINANLSAISTFDYSKVTTVESKIKKLETTEARGTFDVTKRLTKAQYRRIFSTSAILGDSITEGLVDYGYLGSDQVFCKIGASIISGDDLFSSAANTYPKFAFMSFGMNDMGNYSGNADSFIEKYSKLIKEFKKVSPDTRILINGITPPSKEAIAKNSILSNYKKFNNELKKMCKDLKLTYIDNSYIIEDHPNYYAGDGIHVVSEFYPLWMNNMILKAGL